MESGAQREGVQLEPGTPERLGDFRLRERLGAGAMGVIYLAEQLSLKRSVALKLVRPESRFFPEARERFQREAGSAARLVHPGIARVHAHGEQDGVPWIAMELIDGIALSSALGELSGRDPRGLSGADLLELARRAARAPLAIEAPPLAPLQGDWVRSCLWIARELAQALEHAHQQGVLHRDVKPGNVMLSASGRVVLLDFGLARGRSDPRLTRTGMRAGSLAYMAPELLHGEGRSDARADVYSLGVTLFELLALSLPLAEPDEHALALRVASGSSVHLRERLPWLPEDVETVVAMAMDPEPVRRYASAAHLAADLTRLLERQPIEARPASPILRAHRFVQRNPWGTLAAALAAIVLIGGPLAWGWRESRAAELQRALNEQIRASTEEVEAQRSRAEANLDQALEAVDLVLVRAGGEELREIPGMELVRRELYTRALSFYRELLHERPAGIERQKHHAHVAKRAAYAHWDLGQVVEAERLYLESIAEYRDLLTHEPTSAAMRLELAHAMSNLSRLLCSIGRPAEARPFVEEAAVLLDHAGDPASISARQWVDLGASDHNLGLMLVMLGDYPQGLAALDRSLGHVERALELEPGNLYTEADLIDVLAHSAAYLGEQGQPDAALRRFQRARELLEARLERRPEFRDDWLKLERLLVNFGSILQDENRLEDAEVLLQQGLEMARASSARFPEVIDHRRNLGTLEINLAVCRALQERYAEAEDLLRQSCDRLAAIATEQPGVVFNQHFHAIGLAMLGTVLRDQDRFEEAERYLTLALERHREVLRLQPLRTQYRYNEAVTRMNLCDLSLERSQLEGVAEELRAVEDAVAHRPRVLRNLAGLWTRWAAAREHDPSLSEAARLNELERGVEQSLRVLERAVDGGFADREDLAQSELWALLRGSSEFEALLERVGSAAP